MAGYIVDGELWRWWGGSWGGVVGDGTFVRRELPVRVYADGRRFKQHVDGVDIAFGIDDSGNLLGWGYSRGGLLRQADPYVSLPAPELVDIPGAELPWRDVSVFRNPADSSSYGHVLALDAQGKVWAWGYNTFGTIGDDSPVGEFVEYASIAMGDDDVPVAAVSAGGHFSLALDVNGDVWGWGAGWDNQNSHEDGFHHFVPSMVQALPGNIRAISAGDDHAMALDAEGQVWIWGMNWQGQHGVGDDEYYPFARRAIFPENAPRMLSVSAGNYRSLAIDEEGGVWVWGGLHGGWLPGHGGTALPERLTLPADAGPIQIASMGSGTALLMDGRGRVWRWGAGISPYDDGWNSEPVPVPMPREGEELPIGILATREVMAPDMLVLPIQIESYDNYAINIGYNEFINARLYNQYGHAGHFLNCGGYPFSFSLEPGLYHLVVMPYWYEGAIPLNISVNPGASEGYSLLGGTATDPYYGYGYGYGPDPECGSGSPGVH